MQIVGRIVGAVRIDRFSVMSFKGGADLRNVDRRGRQRMRGGIVSIHIAGVVSVAGGELGHDIFIAMQVGQRVDRPVVELLRRSAVQPENGKIMCSRIGGGLIHLFQRRAVAVFRQRHRGAKIVSVNVEQIKTVHTKHAVENCARNRPVRGG